MYWIKVEQIFNSATTNYKMGVCILHKYFFQNFVVESLIGLVSLVYGLSNFVG